jgi:hypothetical protein
VSVHQIWRLPAPSKVCLSADVPLQPSLLRQLEFTATPAECRLPALFGSQRLSKPIARSCQIAAQPLPSYDSVRSAPATTVRRLSASVRRAASDRHLSYFGSYQRHRHASRSGNPALEPCTKTSEGAAKFPVDDCPRETLYKPLPSDLFCNIVPQLRKLSEQASISGIPHCLGNFECISNVE